MNTHGSEIDLVTLGRVNMDLFSRDIGAEFADITSFDAMVGGSPANIAISSSRLGLRTALLSAVGEDRVGDFVLRYLGDEGVDTTYVPRKPGKLTSLALLGVQPPDRFPLSFYREDPADIHLNVTDVDAFPFGQARAFQLSGMALSRGPCAEASVHAAHRASGAGLDTFMDLDLRPTEWPDAESYGRAIATVLDDIGVIIGTEEECYAAFGADPAVVMTGEALPQTHHDELMPVLAGLFRLHGAIQAIVLKRGPGGATILSPSGTLDVAGFPVDVVNTVGAGDAFAGGLITARLRGWDWERSARYANACGAIEVMRHGCSVAFPTHDEVEAFMAGQPV